METIKSRNKSLDIARGLSIFLIVLSHMGISWGFLFDFFYVQVFFFLSGIFLKPNATFENSLYKKTRNLIYPYLFFGIICSVLVLVTKRTTISELHIYDPDSFDNGPQWFLIALYILTLMMICINQIKSIYCKILVICFIFGFCYYLGQNRIDDYTDFTKAGISLPFIFLGGYYLKVENFLKMHKWPLFCIGSIICLVSVFILSITIGIRWLKLPSNPLLYMLASSGGVLLILSLRHIFENCKYINKLLSYWGYYSLFILCMHWPIVRILYDKILPACMKTDIISLFFTVLICSITACIGNVLKVNFKCIF